MRSLRLPRPGGRHALVPATSQQRHRVVLRGLEHGVPLLECRSGGRCRMRVAMRWAVLIICGMSVGSGPEAQTQGTHVPDAITRQSGLRVAPMPRVGQIYATNCQGCHGDLGSSAKEIPTLAGRVGYAQALPAGRAYLVRGDT